MTHGETFCGQNALFLVISEVVFFCFFGRGHTCSFIFYLAFAMSVAKIFQLSTLLQVFNRSVHLIYAVLNIVEIFPVRNLSTPCNAVFRYDLW